MTICCSPVWFFFDTVAWLRVLASFWRFEIASRIAFARATVRRGRCRLLAFDLPWLSALLATAEADLAWALARRAAVIAGLDADRIVRVPVSPAETRRALRIRAYTYCRRFFDFEIVAHKMAARLKPEPAYAIPPAAPADFMPSLLPGRWVRDVAPALAAWVVAHDHAQARAPPRPPACNFS